VTLVSHRAERPQAQAGEFKEALHRETVPENERRIVIVKK
jgi:hypothetical protein